MGLGLGLGLVHLLRGRGCVETHLREGHVELVVEEVELRGCGGLRAGAVHRLAHKADDRTLELLLR